MGRMRVLCEKGDVVIEWDAADAASIKAAKEEFAALKKAGYNFFLTDKRGTDEKPKQVKRFDPSHGQLLVAPGAASTADKKAGRRKKAQRGGPNAFDSRTGRPIPGTPLIR